MTSMANEDFEQVEDGLEFVQEWLTVYNTEDACVLTVERVDDMIEAVRAAKRLLRKQARQLNCLP